MKKLILLVTISIIALKHKQAFAKDVELRKVNENFIPSDINQIHFLTGFWVSSNKHLKRKGENEIPTVTTITEDAESGTELETELPTVSTEVFQEDTEETENKIFSTTTENIGSSQVVPANNAITLETPLESNNDDATEFITTMNDVTTMEVEEDSDTTTTLAIKEDNETTLFPGVDTTMSTFDFEIDTATPTEPVCFCPCSLNTTSDIELLNNATINESSSNETAMEPRGMRNLRLDDLGEEELSSSLSVNDTMQNATSNGVTPEPAKPDLIKQTFGRYFDRIKTIYELDILLLEQLSEALRDVSDEILPSLAATIEPILMSLPPQQPDLAGLVGLAAMTLKGSQFEGGISTKLGNLDFLNIGPIPLRTQDIDLFNDPNLLRDISQLIVAQFDESGLGFPIQALLLGPRALSALSNRQANRNNNQVVSAIIAGKLREFIDSATKFGMTTVTVQGGEVIMDSSVAPVNLVDKCKVSASSGPARAVARVKRSSVLRASGAVSTANDMLTASVFVGGDVDVSLDVKATVKARLGKDILGRCFTKYRNTSPLHVVSNGRVWVGAQLFASDVRIEDRLKSSSEFYRGKGDFRSETQKFLVFKVQLRLSAKINSWDISRLGIANCDLKLFGVKVVSLCGTIRRTLRGYVSRFTYELSEIHMPRLLRRVEGLIRARVGEEIVIPLILADEKQAIVGTLVKKAQNVAKLKGDLINDLAAIAGQIAG